MFITYDSDVCIQGISTSGKNCLLAGSKNCPERAEVNINVGIAYGIQHNAYKPCKGKSGRKRNKFPI
jgi:hypothetical protein